MITRRQAIRAAAALAALAAAGRARAQTPDPLIIRPEISGVDPRYAAYATDGPFVNPSTPLTVKTDNATVVVFRPNNVPEGRIVVFSHGALSDPLTYRDLLWHWSSHGFVVAAPLHQDAVIESGPTLRRNKAGEVSQWPVSALLEDPVAWKQRLHECSSCLDNLEQIEVAAGMKIVADRPVIAGHGYGAYMAQLLLGAQVKGDGGKRMDFRDPRFFSGIALSPQGPGVMGFDERSWEDVASPLLYLVAENDSDFTGQPAMEKAKAYLLAKPGYKHIGFLKGAASNTFFGSRASEAERKLFQVTLAMTVTFLKAYANYDVAAFKDMTTDFFERMALGIVDEGRR